MNRIELLDYDLDSISRSGGTGRGLAMQTVKLTFASGQYRKELTTQVRGNICGLNVIRFAVQSEFEKMLGDDDNASLVLTNLSGTTHAEDEGYDEEWLMDMLIKAEITSVEYRS